MAATEDELRLRDVQAAQRAASEQERAGASASSRPGDPANAIEMRGVSKTYDVSNAGLRNATFAVRRGEFVFMVGPTGSGKSTLMRLLIKELEPDEGRILVAGRIVRDEIGGRYAPADISTAEFGALLREPAPEPRRKGHDDPSDDFDDAFRD